ncbi:MAG: retropepsin-like aspartic protease [Anaerolineae bacterium]
MKFSYDRAYYPSAPSIEIYLAAPESSWTIGPLQAFVDTGADVSLIPAKHIQSLGIPPDDRKFLRSQWGERRKVDVYWLDIGIGGWRFPMTEIVADDRGQEIVVGRNLLNKLVLTLNGPEQVLEVSATNPTLERFS